MFSTLRPVLQRVEVVPSAQQVVVGEERYVVAWKEHTFISFDGFPGRDFAGVGSYGLNAHTPFAIETPLWEASEAPSLASDGRGQTLVVYDRAEGLSSNCTTVHPRLVDASEGRRRGGRDMRWRP